MRIYTFGQHLAITSALKSYIVAKLRKLEPRAGADCSITIRVERDKSHFRTTAMTHMGHRLLHTVASATSVYTAIDQLSLKLKRLVVKQREKRIDKRLRETRSPLSFG